MQTSIDFVTWNRINVYIRKEGKNEIDVDEE